MKLKAKYTDLTAAQKQILGDERKKPEATEAPRPRRSAMSWQPSDMKMKTKAFEQYLKACGLDKPL